MKYNYSCRFTERFSTEYHKTKAVILTNHKGHRQSNEPIKTQTTGSRRKARGNVPAGVKFGFGLASD